MESWANKVEEPCEREEEIMASRIFCSSFLATISAAFPFGQRIKGTRPGEEEWYIRMNA